MRTLTVGASLFFVASLSLVNQSLAFAQPKAGGPPPGPGLTLTSPDFEDGGIIPNKYTQADPNPISPKLEWTHVPPGTVSFALILHDPDVALQKKNDDSALDDLQYSRYRDGASPKCSRHRETRRRFHQRQEPARRRRLHGTGNGSAGSLHHYTFELFALDTKLDLGPDATRADVLAAMQGHILAKGVLAGRFHR